VINIHPIQQLILDLEFIGIKESNNYVFDKASNLSNNQITKVLTTFFDDPRFEHLHYEFNHIELDLGTLPYENFEEKFVEKLIEVIKLKFKNILENNNNDNNYILKDNVQNNYEIIKYYLLNGRLPWWSSKFHNTNIKSIIEDFISNYSSEFKKLLYEIGVDENVRKRIAYSFSENEIKTIIKILQPTEFEYFFSYHSYIINLNKQQKFVQESETNLSKAVWYNIISYILTETSSVFEKKQFLKRNLVSISTYFNIEFLKLIVLIYKATINIIQLTNGDLYNFAKDIQYIYLDTIRSNPNLDLEIFNNETPLNSKNQDRNVQNKFNDDVTEKLYLLNYYLIYGSIPSEYQNLNLDDLKNIFNYLYKMDIRIIENFLFNITYIPGTGKRLYEILNSINYKYAIDLILKKSINYSINDIHKSFIQLLISQNRSTTIFLSDEWKQQLISLVYSLKNSITFSPIFKLYLYKYATVHNVDIFTAIEIYHKDLLLQNNKLLINYLFEYKNEIIQKSEYIALDGHTNQGLLDLLKYLINYGFVPWWGSKYIKQDFKTLLDDLVAKEFKELLKLLKFANSNKETKYRFINLLGVEKTYNILMNCLPKDENFEYYKMLQIQYLNVQIGGIYLNNKKLFITILWDTLDEHNFQNFEPIYFLKKYLFYLNTLTKQSILKIIEQIYIHNEKLNLENQVNFLNILNDLKKIFIDTNDYQIKKKEFINILLSRYDVEKYDNKLFEKYINYLTDTDVENQLTTIKNLTEILNNIFYADKLPKNFKSFDKIDISHLILQSLEFLYEVDKTILFTIFNNFNQFSNTYKSFLTEWLFVNKNQPIAEYITTIIYKDIINDFQYLYIHNFNNTNLFKVNNKFSELFIDTVHNNLKVESNFTNNIILDKYQFALQTFLKNGTIPGFNENIDDLIRFLVINIFQNKGSKTVLDIFNHIDTIFIHKNFILLLFANANNIQERQIYNSLLRSYTGFENNIPLVDLEIDFVNNEDDKNLNIPYNLDQNHNLYDLIKKQLNLSSLNESKYFDELINILTQFLEYNQKPVFISHFNNLQYEFYFKLLIIEIVKKSPSIFYNLLFKYNNQISILFINQLFINGMYDFELTIKNILIDYFRNYTLNNLKLYFKNEIVLNDDQYLNITGNDLTKYTSDLIKINKYDDVYFLLSAQYKNIIDLDVPTIVDQKDNNIYDKTIFLIFIQLIKNISIEINHYNVINNIINKTIITAIQYENKLIKNDDFIDMFLLAIVNTKNEKILLPSLISHLNNINITQPFQLVQLIDQTINKSKRILYKQIDENINLKDNEIKIQVNTIKDQYENMLKAHQLQDIEKQQSNANNDLEDNLKNVSIYVNNVGLTLFHLFIPTFFQQLNLLNTDGEFLNIDCQYRAVHLLQLLVSDASYDEHELVLNKILCNLEINESIPMDIEFTEKEKALSLELINVVLQRWDKMKNSSIGHLRAAFLMRDGKLKLKTDGWYLNVEKRGYDVILSTIPWAFGVVKFKWMHKFLYTEWT
jgi:hypothetical protein